MTTGTVYVIGVFDLFHRGHVALLKTSRDLGDRLLVAVNSDRIVAAYKASPIMKEGDRLAVVQACRHVDEAFIIDDLGNKSVLARRPDITTIVHGDDWPRASYLQQLRLTEADLAEFGVTLMMVPYTEGISTSSIIRTIRESK